MTRVYEISDFPLEPVDHLGRSSSVGDEAKIIEIPDTGFHGFDAIARKRYAALKDRILPITEFDESGHAVFWIWYTATSDVIGSTDDPASTGARRSHGFCFDPRDLERV